MKGSILVLVLSMMNRKDDRNSGSVWLIPANFKTGIQPIKNLQSLNCILDSDAKPRLMFACFLEKFYLFQCCFINPFTGIQHPDSKVLFIIFLSDYENINVIADPDGMLNRIFCKFWIRRGGTRQSSISSAYSTMAKKVSG